MSGQRYTPEFKDEAVKQVLDRGYTIGPAGKQLMSKNRDFCSSPWLSGGPLANQVLLRHTLKLGNRARLGNGKKSPSFTQIGKSANAVPDSRAVKLFVGQSASLLLGIEVLFELCSATVHGAQIQLFHLSS